MNTCILLVQLWKLNQHSQNLLLTIHSIIIQKSLCKVLAGKDWTLITKLCYSCSHFLFYLCRRVILRFSGCSSENFARVTKYLLFDRLICVFSKSIDEGWNFSCYFIFSCNSAIHLIQIKLKAIKYYYNWKNAKQRYFSINFLTICFYRGLGISNLLQNQSFS